MINVSKVGSGIEYSQAGCNCEVYLLCYKCELFDPIELGRWSFPFSVFHSSFFLFHSLTRKIHSLTDSYVRKRLVEIPTIIIDD